MPRSVAVVGGGIAGLSAAYELSRLQQDGADLSFTLFEKSKRLGGTVDTLRERGFVIECGPDGWVTEKPWARELAEELGLGDQLIVSKDHERITWVLQGGKLLAMPDNMRMMVPESMDSIMQSPLFSEAARAAYAAEEQRADALKAAAPNGDESVASFIGRHFGDEVLRVIGAPLLGGVFGGDVHKLSVRAVMPAFVAMEREYGSLIRALTARKLQRGDRPAASVFTSLRGGTGLLIERMAATLPPVSLRMETEVTAIQRVDGGWLVTDGAGDTQRYGHLMLALPVPQAARLLQAVDTDIAAAVTMPTSSAVIAGFGFEPGDAPVLPQGFGFLCPEGEDSELLAATFADQKFDGRVPVGGKSVRAYFGGATADALMASPDDEIKAKAMRELEKVLGPMPEAAVAMVRRLPNALPQYEVGHLDRMAVLQRRVDALGGLHLLGNGYRGVGLPDLIRDGRAAARSIAD